MDSDYDLILPELPRAASESPKLTMHEMAKLCEEMLPKWNQERFSRPQAKDPEPFRLFE